MPSRERLRISPSGIVGSNRLLPPVMCVATENLNLAVIHTELDGITLTAGCRVLLPVQTNAVQNGTYEWSATTRLLTRSQDLIVKGSEVLSQEGNVYGDTTFALTNSTDPIVGTDALGFLCLDGVSTGNTKIAVAGPLNIGAVACPQGYRVEIYSEIDMSDTIGRGMQQLREIYSNPAGVVALVAAVQNSIYGVAGETITYAIVGTNVNVVLGAGAGYPCSYVLRVYANYFPLAQ